MSTEKKEAIYLKMVGLDRIISLLSGVLSGSLHTSLQMFRAINVSDSMEDKEA